ncbi:MAG: NADH-quinone oxidoreductase subunit D, partial [Sphingobacteriales bacterium]
TLTLKVVVARNAEGEPLPEVPTVSHIWRTADWHEREIFDLIGISFSGHPDMRRILCSADWEGHPLRRDYVAQEFYHGIRVPFDNHNFDNGYQGEPLLKKPTQILPATGEKTATAAQLLHRSEPLVTDAATLSSELMLINMGPQHPATHGVLRLEVISDGEVVKEVIPHIGYLHRCFEKHAEAKAFNQTIPFVDRLDYLAAMNSEHVWAMGVEKMLGITENIPKRVEYIRVLVAELNRIASHFVAIGTYAMDIGAFTPFLWMMRDREHIQRLLEWVSGARMLYNYIWIGGLYYDLPIGFEQRCREFVHYLRPKMDELFKIVIENKIFIQRAANVGVLPLDVAINYGCTGSMLRGSGLRYDLRKVDAYSVYPELDFDVPVGEGKMGTTGDCWDRNYVRALECLESLKMIEQCLDKLETDYKRTRDFDPQAAVPKKIRPIEQDFYFRGETPRGELGFFFRTTGRSDIPFRSHCRSCCFSNLSVLHEISRGAMVTDLIAIVGSVDIVLGELDR